MARDQLFELQMCCMGWVFLIQCCSFGQYSGKVVILSSLSVKSCAYCNALHSKARFSYRNKSLLSWSRPDVGPVRNYLPCFVLKRKACDLGAFQSIQVTCHGFKKQLLLLVFNKNSLEMCNFNCSWLIFFFPYSFLHMVALLGACAFSILLSWKINDRAIKLIGFANKSVCV